MNNAYLMTVVGIKQEDIGLLCLIDIDKYWHINKF